MADQPGPQREPPEAGVGGEGLIVDQRVLAPTTDREIAEAVHAALLLDADVDADRFTVDVTDGVVRLAGRPRTVEERRRALQDAGQVPNVRRVLDATAPT